MIHCTCLQSELFVDDPAAIEREFPMVRILGSFYASVRGSAGICRDRDRFMDRSVITGNTGGSWYPTYPQISNHSDTPLAVQTSIIR